MLLCHRAQNRQADRVISSHANTAYPHLQKRGNSPLDAAEGVLYRKRIYRKIAEIGGAVFGEGIYVQYGIPRPDDRRLSAYVARAEARPRTISGSTIEWHANQSNIQLFRLHNMGQAHERWDARKPRITQRVGRLGMGQLELPPGWRHRRAS